MVLADSKGQNGAAQSALEERDAIVAAEMKSSGDAEGLLDMTADREKLWSQGWTGKEETEVVEFPLDEPSWTSGTQTGYDYAILDGVKICVGDNVAIRYVTSTIASIT